MVFLYNSGIFLYKISIQLASVAGNKKAFSWIKGRKNWVENTRDLIKKNGKTYWFHCASLGEFEQGRSLLESIRADEPEANIILTFFSPSGYEVRKSYSNADHVLYLPLDGKKNAEQFVKHINPDVVFFVKYDYWYHYLKVLKQQNIPVYIVSGIFRKNQHFFSWYGKFFRNMLRTITHFFIQDETSAALLQNIGISNYTISGDTRFDRVIQKSETKSILPVLDAFKGNAKLLVCGSTWPADEVLLQRVFHRLDSPNIKFLIAPHDISTQRIQHLLISASANLKESEVQLYSGTNSEKVKNCRILILDTMGQLSSVYSYGSIAYVGGGFGKGIHNTLEPAAYGIPVLFGPKFKKFREAIGLIQAGAAFTVNTEDELALIIDTLLKQVTFINGAGNAAREYVQKNAGATIKIRQELHRQGIIVKST